MTKHTTAFIWRQSIYENDFKCKCGYKVYNAKKIELNRNVMIDTDNYMFCPECGLCIGRIEDIGETNMKPGLYGSWEEWQKKQAN